MPDDKKDLSSATSDNSHRDWWKATKELLGFLETVSKIVFPILLFYMGYLVKDSVDLALKRDQLDISSAKEMQAIIGELRANDLTPERAEGAALALSAYGRFGIPPLINELNMGSVVSAPAVERALMMSGLTHRDETCARLGQVIQNRSGYFSWQTHKAAIKLIGEIGCTDCDSLVRKYALLVADDSPESLQRYSRGVSGKPTIEHLTLIREAVNHTLEVLNEKKGTTIK